MSKISDSLSAVRSITPLFRTPFLAKIVQGTHRKLLSEVLVNLGISHSTVARKRLKTLLDELYNELCRVYQCEYVFKNVVANSLYLNRHDPNEAFLTDEFRSGRSRADVVILNGTSTVYEIKTEFDSFNKLPTQLHDYKKIFDLICVVVPPSLQAKASEFIHDGIGLLVLDEHLDIIIIKEPESNRSFTSPAEIFDCMRRAEYQRALLEVVGYVPNVPNTLMYGACKKIFGQLPPATAHDLMVRYVKQRSRNGALKRLLEKVPLSLKHACLTLSESKSFIQRLEVALNQPVGIL